MQTYLTLNEIAVKGFSEKFLRRFWKKIQKTETCWNWIGGNSQGYGLMGLQGQYRTEFAHRISWVIHIGAIPTGLYVLHSCDNPACVNPEHLFLGTAKTNSDDMFAKGRQSTGNRRFTDEQAKEILSLAGKMTQKEIAAQFNISKSAISHIHTYRQLQTFVLRKKNRESQTGYPRQHS